MATLLLLFSGYFEILTAITAYTRTKREKGGPFGLGFRTEHSGTFGLCFGQVRISSEIQIIHQPSVLPRGCVVRYRVVRVFRSCVYYCEFINFFSDNLQVFIYTIVYLNPDIHAF